MADQEIIDELWTTYDKNHNDRIDRDEFDKFMNDICRMIGRKISHSDYDKLFHKSDVDRSGYLSKDQFSILIGELNKSE